MLYLIGVVTIFIWLCKIASFVHLYFLKPDQFHRFKSSCPDGDDAWALVTEASSQVGLQFARELAHRGFNVALQGSAKDELESAVSELREKYRFRSFMVIVADSSTVGESNIRNESRPRVNFEYIQSRLSHLNLTVLVNNVSRRSENNPFGLLTSFSETQVIQDTSSDIIFPLLLIRALLPTLIRNSPAVIITIGSIIDEGYPLLVSHTASMSFLNTMTKALALEMKFEGHDVESICVRMCAVKGIEKNNEAPSRFTPSIEDAVKAALARIGGGKRSLAVYWAQALKQKLVDMIPGTIWEEVIVHNMRRAKHRALQLHHVK